MSRETNVRELPAERSSRRTALLIPTVATVALLTAVAYLVFRGLMRALHNSQDLTVGYAAARAWLAGDNPYDPARLAAELARGGEAQWAASGVMDVLLNIYFPTTIPLYLWLIPMTWTQAKLAWLALNCVAAIITCLALIRFLRWGMVDERSLLLIAAFLALAPVHSTMAFGQTAIIATALLVAALRLEHGHKNVWAGIAYGLATAIKVQIGLPFIAYILWRRRWGAASAAIGLLALLTALSIGRMAIAEVPWYSTWTSNLHVTTTGGGLNDASPENSGKHSLINLHYPLHELIDSNTVVNALVLVLVGAAALLTVYCIRGRRPPVRRELLALSIVAMLTLLVTYHRTYDAVLLVFPIAWALSTSRELRLNAATVLVCALDFLVPIQTMLAVWERAGRFPAWMTDNLVWNAFIVPQQVWAVVAITLVLLHAAWRTRDEGAMREKRSVNPIPA